jgi:sirohydrochlorin cobaltochelatase
MKRAYLLIGHGSPARGTPKELVQELSRLEKERVEGGAPSARERELDALVRAWPRPAGSDPYKEGLEALAEALRATVDAPVLACYNEFCAPSVQDAVDALAARGVEEIVALTTMLSRGGVHSEREIPEELERASRSHPGVAIRYVWPVPEQALAGFLASLAQERAPRPEGP